MFREITLSAGLVVSLAGTTTAIIGTPDLLQLAPVAVTMPADAGGEWTAANLVDPGIHRVARTPDTKTTSTVIDIDLGQGYLELPVRVFAIIGGNWTSGATISGMGAVDPIPTRVRVAPKKIVNSGAFGVVESIDEPVDTAPDGQVVTIPNGGSVVVEFDPPPSAPPAGAQRQLLRVLARCLDPATITLEARDTTGGQIVQVSRPLTTAYLEYIVALDAADLSSPLVPSLTLAITTVVDGGASVEIEAVEWTYDPDPVGDHVRAAWRRAASVEHGPGGLAIELMPQQLAKTAVVPLSDGHHHHRYWRIEVRDPGNPDGYLQFGRAWLSPAITGAHLLGNTSIELEAIGGEHVVSAGGVSWVSPPSAIRRRVDLELRATADVGIRELFGGVALTGALRQPFVLAMHPDGLPDDQASVGFYAIADGDGSLDLLADRRGLPTANSIRVVEVT